MRFMFAETIESFIRQEVFKISVVAKDLLPLCVCVCVCAPTRVFVSLITHNGDISPFRFNQRQIHASEDDGSVNHALIRDLDEEAERLEKFGAELETA